MISKKNRKTILILMSVVIGMFGFAFAMVPLYNTLCDLTGFNGKTGGRVKVDSIQAVDTSRTIKVQFVTQLNEKMPWKFYPEVETIYVHPGEVKKIQFYVENQTDHATIGQAIPSVTPASASIHLKKVECFCFNNQALEKFGKASLPLIFFIDKNLPPEIEELTLSYTMFDITR